MDFCAKIIFIITEFSVFYVPFMFSSLEAHQQNEMVILYKYGQ